MKTGPASMNPRWAGNAAPLARSGFGSGDAGFPVRRPLPVGGIRIGAGPTGLGASPGPPGGAGVWPKVAVAHTAPVNRKAILFGIELLSGPRPSIRGRTLASVRTRSNGRHISPNFTPERKTVRQS